MSGGCNHTVSFSNEENDEIHSMLGIVTEFELGIWSDVKTEIIQFLKSFNCEYLNKIRKEIRKWNSPEEIELVWKYEQDHETTGKVMHDIVNILILVYRRKIQRYYPHCYAYSYDHDHGKEPITFFFYKPTRTMGKILNKVVEHCEILGDNGYISRLVNKFTDNNENFIQQLEGKYSNLCYDQLKDIITQLKSQKTNISMLLYRTKLELKLRDDINELLL